MGGKLEQGRRLAKAGPVYPETRISFLFARCRATQPRYSVDPSVGLNYTPAARTDTVIAYGPLLLLLHLALIKT